MNNVLSLRANRRLGLDERTQLCRPSSQSRWSGAVSSSVLAAAVDGQTVTSGRGRRVVVPSTAVDRDRTCANAGGGGIKNLALGTPSTAVARLFWDRPQCSIAVTAVTRRQRHVKPGPHQQQCRSNVRLCQKYEISTQNSFDIVAVFGNKVERCFDIVAGVDRA